jgi:hypothetical protein
MHQVWTLLKLSAEYRESKITYLDLPLFIYQNVLWLQVSVRDPSLMTIVNSSKNLIKVLSGRFLIHSILI